MENYERIENPDSSRQEQRPRQRLPIEDHPIDAHADEHSISFVEALRISLVALCALAAWLRLWEPFPRISLVGVAGVLIGGWPIFREAAENIAARRMTMELSMSIAIIAAAAISEFFTASNHHPVRSGRGGPRTYDGCPRTTGQSVT